VSQLPDAEEQQRHRDWYVRRFGSPFPGRAAVFMDWSSRPGEAYLVAWNEDAFLRKAVVRIDGDKNLHVALYLGDEADGRRWADWLEQKGIVLQSSLAVERSGFVEVSGSHDGEIACRILTRDNHVPSASEQRIADMLRQSQRLSKL
jgi:catechol 2,3-dioxygenase-like lactoylglutathione lyase family enzyme